MRKCDKKHTQISKKQKRIAIKGFSTEVRDFVCIFLKNLVLPVFERRYQTWTFVILAEAVFVVLAYIFKKMKS